MKMIRLMAIIAAAVVICGQTFAASDEAPRSGKIVKQSDTAGGPVRIAAVGSVMLPMATAKPPTVIDHSPVGMGVSASTSVIEVVFSANMSRTPTRSAFSVSPRPSGGLVWASSTTLQFRLTAALAQDTTYTVTISTAAVSGSGLHLAAPYTWSFSTSIPAQSTSIACCGDSITAGLYPGYLQSLFGTSAEVSDFGVGGKSVIIRSGIAYINTSACQQAEASLPGTVVIMLGSNDTDPSLYQYISNFVADYERLVRQFQTVSSASQIWLATPPRIYNNPYRLSNANLINGVIPRIGQVANAMGVQSIDVYSPTNGHPEYFTDGVHPNDLGASVIANVIHHAIAPGP